VITKDGFIITIDTTYARNFDFSIFGKDIGGIFNQSKFVHIKVVEEPEEIAIGLINSPPFFDKDIPRRVSTSASLHLKFSFPISLTRRKISRQ
jgi:hypothetical protein